MSNPCNLISYICGVLSPPIVLALQEYRQNLVDYVLDTSGWGNVILPTALKQAIQSLRSFLNLKSSESATDEPPGKRRKKGDGVCRGSCHIKLRGVGPDDPLFIKLHSQMDYCKDSWRSKHCQHVVNAERLDSKNRCPRCQSLDKNIRPG